MTVLAAGSILFGLLFATQFMRAWNSLWVLLAGGGLFFLYRRLLTWRDRRGLLLSGVYAVLLSMAICLGRQIDFETEDFILPGMGFPVRVLLLGLLLFGIAGNVMMCLLRTGDRVLRQKGPGWQPIQWGIAGGLAALLCWGVFYVAYYPGATSIDSYYIILQALGEIDLSDAHPFTYTLIAKLFVGLGNALGGITLAVGLFTLAHLLFSCFAVAYLVYWLAKRGLCKLFLVATVVYFAASPIFGSLSITLWKDMPFSICVMLYVIQLIEVVESGGQRLKTLKGAAAFVAATFFTSMLRHNGFYVVIVMTLLLTVLYVIKLKKACVRVVAVILAAALLVPLTRNVYYACGVAKGSSVEAISVPVQQITRTVVKKGNISDDQRHKLAQFFDLTREEIYDPLLADPAKNSVDKGYFNEHKGEFLSLWLDLFKENKGHYASAYLLLTSGYWSPGVKDVIIDPRANYMEAAGVKKAVVPALVQRSPWGHVAEFDTVSIGSLVWTMLFCMVLLLYKKQYWYITALLPIVGVWMTLLVATPAYCSYRYIYVLPLAMPLIMFLAIASPGVKKGEGKKETGRVRDMRKRNSEVLHAKK